MAKEPGRNDPCPCGSGKKYKNCCLGRKPVSASLTFKHPEGLVVTSYSVSADGQIVLNPERAIRPESTWFEQSYERSKGPKSLFKTAVDPNFAMGRAVGGAPLTDYDNVFVVDTNTDDIDGTQVSITCILECGPAIDRKHGAIFVSIPLACFEFHDCPKPQEEFAIHILQSMILGSSDYSKEKRYAIINDSNLGELERRNKREVPIFGEAYLAQNIDLIYASADSGRALGNLLIKECDKIAKNLHDNLSEEGLSGSGARGVKDAPCTKFNIYPLPTAKEALPVGWLRLSFNIPLTPRDV